MRTFSSQFPPPDVLPFISPLLTQRSCSSAVATSPGLLSLQTTPHSHQNQRRTIQGFPLESSFPLLSLMPANPSDPHCLQLLISCPQSSPAAAHSCSTSSSSAASRFQALLELRCQGLFCPPRALLPHPVHSCRAQESHSYWHLNSQVVLSGLA